MIFLVYFLFSAHLLLFISQSKMLRYWYANSDFIQCGSGGGLRALVAGAASYLSAQEVVDCATFTAGVSGSCWLQTLYNSSIGGCRFDKIIDHLKRRIGVVSLSTINFAFSVLNYWSGVGPVAFAIILCSFMPLKSRNARK